MPKQADVNIRERLIEAIGIQRDRIYKFKTSKEPDQKLWNDAIRTLGQLLNQMRSLTKDQIKWSKSLTLDERREVIVSWFQSLTRVQQERLLSDLHAAFRERYSDHERTLDT